MRILFIGDVVGRSGREAVATSLPKLREAMRIDLAVVNAENASHGFGLSPEMATALFGAGADVITLGNHAWVAGGRRVLVTQAMGRLYMDPLDCPFRATADLFARHRLGGTVAAILVDFHAEASSEKMAFAHFLDGQVSAVIGTHTHCPSADAQVLPGGTAFQSDAGMSGDYDSVIGMAKDAATLRFWRKMPGERLAPAEGEATVCGVFVETDDATGLARRVAPVRVGGRLAEAMPTG
jgi:calcineurin-like phosphoesterase